MGFGLEKRKSKKPTPNLEFVSPYPLEDCVWQLQNFPGVDERFPIETKVKLWQIDEETWGFRIIKSYYNLGSLAPNTSSRKRTHGLIYPKLLAEGHLKTTSSYTTLVIGMVSVGRKISISGLLIACIFVIILLSGIIPALKSAPQVAILLVFAFTMLIIISSIFGLLDNDQRFVHAMKGHIKGVLGN
jgi:hypothetical protein